MRIDLKKVKKLAQLSKLNLNDEEAKNMFSDFKTMVSFINQLDEVSVDNIEPLIHVHEQPNIYREDIIDQEKLKKPILKQSASHNSDYFKVPKVIKK
tara:strand:- start:604 stop:894 length:291 start_codon:yes stop_codon:yes gene_type:complete